MTVVTDQLAITLRRHGHSITTARTAVFAALVQADSLTMQQLAHACAGQADRASVYRVVTLFEKLGIVRRIQTGWKYQLELGDNFRPHHHHLFCTGCGVTRELPEDESLEHRLHGLAEQLDFAPSDHMIEIRGLCSDCQK